MTSTDTDAVEREHAAFYEAIEAGDIDRMAELWAPDGLAGGKVTWIHPSGQVLRGRTEVLRGLSLIIAGTYYVQYVLTDTDVRVFGDFAVVTCGENIIAANDPQCVELSGGSVIATNAFVRTDRGWRIWLHQGSPVLAATIADDDER